MTFYQFIQTFLPHHTPLPQFLHSINQHTNFPTQLNTHTQIFSYFPTNPPPQTISLPLIKPPLSLFNQFTNLQSYMNTSTHIISSYRSHSTPLFLILSLHLLY
ncbi:YozE family protein, partial [Staphylococcus aureus]|uniref:YozE family protein n=1 Tax=Staphylococcus aureus TaxID=1280 RepID=UPI001643627A